MRAHVTVLIAALLFAPACGSSSTEIAVGSISGTVTGPNGGVQGAKVIVASDTAITGSNGGFSVTGIPVGPARVKLIPPDGFVIATGDTVDKSVSVSTGAAVVVNFQLALDVSILASLDFEDSTFGDFQQLTPLRAIIMSDPTNTGHGRVARLEYFRDDTTTPPDRNISFNWLPATGFGLGGHFFFKGEVFIPTPASNMVAAQRKLVYWQKRNASGNPNSDFMFVKLEGTELEVEMRQNGTHNDLFKLTTVTWDQWHTLEVETLVNSALGKADGVLRVWWDGTKVLESTDREWTTGSADFDKFLVGDQAQGNPLNTLYDEFRYWDNVKFSKTRQAP